MGPLHLAIVLGCAALISAQTPETGKCPEIKTMEKFDVDKYAGLWYEIQKTQGIISTTTKCDSIRYNKLENGTVEVINSLCFLDNKISIVGNAAEEAKDSLKDGKLKIRYPVIANVDRPYYVLDTDYDSYSIVWSCQELGTDPNQQHIKSLWVLGKDTKLTDAQKKTVTDKLKELKLETVKLTDTDQKKCCYDATKSDDDDNSAASVGLSMALLLSTVMVRFL